jgi:hypothetical protein
MVRYSPVLNRKLTLLICNWCYSMLWTEFVPLQNCGSSVSRRSLSWCWWGWVKGSILGKGSLRSVSMPSTLWCTRALIMTVQLLSWWYVSISTKTSSVQMFIFFSGNPVQMFILWCLWTTYYQLFKGIAKEAVTICKCLRQGVKFDTISWSPCIVNNASNLLYILRRELLATRNVNGTVATEAGSSPQYDQFILFLSYWLPFCTQD